MANKKITVVGDGAEEPLTPEEEHLIEVKIDRMLDPAGPDIPVTSSPTDAQPAVPIEEKPTEASPVPAETPAAAEAVPAAPKVTKIVTQFADEPEEAPVPQEPEVPAPAPEPPKPTVKKITIKHHDELEPETAEEKPESEEKKPAVKASKPKHTTKKPAKKTKVSDADSSSTDDLAAKADAITAAALAAEEFADTKPADETAEAAVGSEEPAEEKPPTAAEESAEEAETAPDAAEPQEEAEEEPLETTDDQDGGAPPLIQKHSVAPIGAPVDTDEEAAEPEAEKTEAPSGATEPETSSEPASSVKITVAEPEGQAEEIPVEVEPEADTEGAPEATGAAQTDEEKKYRPPDGPIQFKRAEVPIQPLKPGEPRAEQPLDELSEDEALARAFETPKTNKKTEKKPRKPLNKRKTLLAVFIILILAGGGAVAAMPSLRQKAKDLIGLDKKTPVVSTPAPAKAKTPAAAAPLSPDIFISKRDGVYNIYKLSAGQPEQLILAGTGNETDKIALAANNEGTFAALVSTRDAKRNSAGALQQSMNIISVAGSKATAVDNADQIKLIDWFGSKAVYVLLNTSTSTSDPNRYQIVSYDTGSNTRTVLDHMNYLNEVLAAKGKVYYATATGPSGPGQVASILPDGSDKQTIVTGEIAAITRVSHDSAVLSGVNKWYGYTFGEKTATLTNNVSQKSRLYIDSPDGKHSVYVNDSKIVLVDTVTAKEKQLAVTKAAYPIRWLSNDTLVYRSGEADYQVKITGGQPSKVADVSAVAGISLWHE
jgi:hypothetical protein